MRKHVSISLAVAAIAGCGTMPVAGLGHSATSSLQAERAILAGRVIVGFKGQVSQATLAAFTAKSGTTLVKSLPRLGMAVFSLGRSTTKAAMLAVPGVEFVESELLPELEPIKVQPALGLNLGANGDDPQRGNQWYLDLMGISKVQAEVGALKPVTVAVVDTGVDLTHPDMAGRFVQGTNTDKPGTPPQDTAGHGSMTSGLIGANSNNGVGISGIAPNASIMPCKVGNSASSVCEAMQFAADHADMITMSLSFKPYMSEYGVARKATLKAAQYVMAHNIPMVCSMGNTGDSSENVPSYFAGSEVPGLIAVGATDDQDHVPDFSTYGRWVSVSAPGKHIMTTQLGGGYGYVDGTSFSTPITAGVVALMLGHGAAKDPAAIKDKLEKSAVDIGAAGFDNRAGFGRVDAYKAIMQ